MKLIVERVENGYVLKYKDPITEKIVTQVFDNELQSDIQALRTLFYNIEELVAETTSRYSKERLFIGAIPGDKYEGEHTKEVKDTIDSLSWLFTKESLD